MRGASRPSPLLVTGGAGYIGSHALFALRAAGWPAVALDHVSPESRAVSLPDAPPVEESVTDRRLLDDLFTKRSFKAVLHSAGSMRVEDSSRAPLPYYRNNAVASHHLSERLTTAGVEVSILASTAAVSGTREAHPGSHPGERARERTPARAGICVPRRSAASSTRPAATAAAAGPLRSTSGRGARTMPRR